MTSIDTIEQAFGAEKALVFGIGGSGDIVGSLPTARLLESHGVEVLLGGIAWEPAPTDHKPGPRSLDEIRDIRRLDESVGLISGESTTEDGLEFTETIVARHLGAEVVLFDLEGGPVGMQRGLRAVSRKEDIDIVVGVDAGGDVLADGSEPGLRSPVTDGYGIVSLSEVSVPSAIGVFGYGSDGELSIQELEAAIADVSGSHGLLGAWGLSYRVREEMIDLLTKVETEASRLPVEAATGEIGSRTIRGGDVTVSLTPCSTVTFYFDPDAVAERSDIATRIQGVDSLDAATDSLRRAGYPIEFETDRDRSRRSE